MIAWAVGRDTRRTELLALTPSVGAQCTLFVSRLVLLFVILFYVYRTPLSGHRALSGHIAGARNMKLLCDTGLDGEMEARERADRSVPLTSAGTS